MNKYLIYTLICLSLLLSILSLKEFFYDKPKEIKEYIKFSWYIGCFDSYYDANMGLANHKQVQSYCSNLIKTKKFN